MLKRYLPLALSALFIAACAVNRDQQMMVLSYQAFGPQVTATEVLGNEWWQWQAHGDSRPRDYDVKVVVYRGISLIDVKAAYPVIEEKH
ncbi:hypothetical protein [Gallaecimonas xiamenensis]|uniref:Lipoprotein n=1 Tax=Gallaecimonas xiamenensis 3-C-1 TaxID=745411 RepID=K2JZD0_9GAMM|nr:hypothetical protein [Gallaecimonas xiamenensis]EKE70635.1 hypothetical protein B3C1_13893 [Gallaecimonas xiamenensis 3-C-1]